MGSVRFESFSGDPQEIERVELLHQLRAIYDLSRFERTNRVVVRARTPSRSHPVLTVSTPPTDEVGHLAMYLHEQLHWWSADCGTTRDQDDAIFAALRDRFSPVPVGRPDPETEFSSLLHYHVNWLELEALASLVGDDAAVARVLATPYYPSIYRQVVEHRAWLGDLFTEQGAGLPTAGVGPATMVRARFAAAWRWFEATARQSPPGADIGEWTVQEMLAHVAFWMETVPPFVTGAFRGDESAFNVTFPSGFQPQDDWPDADTHNAREAAWARTVTFDEVLTRLRAAATALDAFLDSLTDEEADANSDYFFDVDGHLLAHLQDLVAAGGPDFGPSGPPAV